jgi:two-component system, chemotaxis family, protein-glutamate methylesterase/glutaminase
MAKYEAVAIGGSWGGMEAVSKILAGLPTAFKLPIIIILHRLKNVESELPRLVAKNAKLRVKEIDEKEKILPGYVYIAPANYHVLIEQDKTFSLCVSELVHYSRPSLDVSFKSAADVYKDKLVGIILTGANRDGSEGLNEIKCKGGLTIVQDPLEAEVDTMPKAAIKKTHIDHVLTLEGIKNMLIKLNEHV